MRVPSSLEATKAVAPAGFFRFDVVEAFGADDAFEIERDFGFRGGDFELDGVVAVVLRTFVGRDLVPAVVGAL